MKFKIVAVITILSTILIAIIGFIRNDTDFTVLATSYSESSTTLYNYNNKKVVDTNTFPIGGVENLIYDDKGHGIMYDNNGDQLVTIVDDETKNYNINNNPSQLIKNDNGQYMLHNGNLKFSISKYNEEYDKLVQSEKLPGFAQNFIIHNDSIYVLTNVYDENSNRKVTIYALDINSLKVLNSIEVSGLTFGFYIREVDGDLKIYGNSNEEAKDLSIYTHQLANKKTNLKVKSDIKVMWVSKVIDINEKEIILNDFSIVSVDKNNVPKIEFKNDQTLIDLEYNKAEECYYLLAGDFDKNQFEVHKLNSNFDIIESSSLDLGHKKPTDLLLN
jgi:hypothetical protein